MNYCFTELKHALSVPRVSGRLKASYGDFRVDEIMPVVPSGEGEHLWLEVEKQGANTDWVAQQLARHAGVKPMAVSYAGMKDRYAVTRQWFSIHLPGKDDPDFSSLPTDEYRVLQQSRHSRKLKRGTLSGNRFQIRISELQGDMDSLEQSLQQIKRQGVPNYFGEQRFGRQMANLSRAEKLFRRELKKVTKQQRGLYLSAARAWIFNQLLSRRIAQQNWLGGLSGEVYMLNARSACFTAEHDEVIEGRLVAGEIHPTGCLWGEGESMALDQVRELEGIIAEEYSGFARGLEAARLKQERRALRLMPVAMNWEISPHALLLDFELPAGTFATMVLRECVNTAPDEIKNT